jgi:hypothetical protein
VRLIAPVSATLIAQQSTVPGSVIRLFDDAWIDSQLVSVWNTANSRRWPAVVTLREHGAAAGQLADAIWRSDVSLTGPSGFRSRVWRVERTLQLPACDIGVIKVAAR